MAVLADDRVILYKQTKPDCDNLWKQVGDAMEGVVYLNDSQICKIEITKIFGTTPRTEILIYQLEQLASDKCKDCDGTGLVPGSSLHCHKCGGTGRIQGDLFLDELKNMPHE